jgi:peptidoglycan/LPS O-acetylase OafA/YrhL
LEYLKELNRKLFAEITEVPVALQGSYYPALDGLRGVSILIVVLGHIGLNYYLVPYHLLVDSDTGVHIFFVISGFLITTLLLKEKLKNDYISLKRFYIRRALRILPVAYLFLVVLIGLNLFFKLKIQPLDFIASFLFFKNLPIRNEPYTAHFWSLAVEEQFYLTFPFLLASNINRYLLTALFFIVVIPIIAVLGYYQVNIPAIPMITKICMYMFWKGPVIILIGSVFSILMFKGIIKPERIKPNYFLSFILLIIAVTISAKTFMFYSKYISEYLSAILIACVIILSINTKNLLSDILSSGLLVRVGILSYSIYIWQELFIGRRTWQQWMHVFQHFPVWILIILKLAFIFVIASVSFMFEKIFLKIKDKYRYSFN